MLSRHTDHPKHLVTRQGELAMSETTTAAHEDAIRRLFARHCRGMDRVDAEMIASCYWPGAIDDHGTFVGTGAEFAVQPWRSSPVNVSAHHLLGQSLIEVHGTRALGETYFSYTGIRAYAEGDRWVEVKGRYLDRLELRDGQWKLSYRKVVIDASREQPAESSFRESSEHSLGGRHPDDLSYHMTDDSDLKSASSDFGL
jgi:hypothetical protein